MGKLPTNEEASLFDGLTPDQSTAVAKVAREFGFKKGEYLFRLGEEATTLMVLNSGTVELTLPLLILNEDRELVVQELNEGETLAWSALVAPHVLTMSARATTEVKLVGFARDELLKLFKSEPEIGYRVMANLAAIMGRRLHVTHALWTRELQRSVENKYR